MAVRGTTNYVYFTDRPLGTGACGTVYFGRHKKRGDPCAIKVFHSTAGRTMKELQLREREFNFMSKLNHDNIVKFINIEPESHGSDRVLIMELCTGGSVFNMLEDPENAFGFPEDEYLVFLSDITKALQYLRHHGIVHRDIKPGNILRYIKDDLSSLYKLTDFGAARELPEDGEFMSLYGTEEYLHPDLYARALMRHQWLDQYPKSFNASVDLWSLGVTLYHVASGRLPFQPFGGRKNREAMHLIISRKEAGFISGVQQTKDGGIEWSRDLPKTCFLSSGLKKFLVPILVGLLESEKRRQWTFDNFFCASKDITCRTVVHIFSVSDCSQNRLYLGKEERKSLTHFQDVLADFTKIPSSHQLLFHETWSVESLVVAGNDKPVPIQVTSAEHPLFVVPVNQASAKPAMENYDLPTMPVIPSAIDIFEDAEFARSASAYVMFLQTGTDHLLRAQKHLAFVASHLGNLLTTNSQDLQLIFDNLVPMYEKLLIVKAGSSSPLDEFNRQFSDMAAIYEKVLDAVTKFSQDAAPKSLLLAEFLKGFSAKICPPSLSCSRKQAHLVKDLETIRICFKEHKKKDKTLLYNEQQIHKFDRGRAADRVKRSCDLYTKHCVVNTEAAWKVFQSYHKFYSKRKAEIEQTENNLQELLDKITTINENLFNLLVKFSREKNVSREVNAIERNSESSKKDFITPDQSSALSAFMDKIAISGFDKSDAAVPGYRIISKECVPGEIRTDSGIEILAESLKDTLKDTNDLLEMTISTSNENSIILQKLHSQCVVPAKS